MAKNTQEAEVIVTLNGQAAKRAIKEMEQEYDRLTKAALEAHKAGNDALGKELDAKAQKLMKDVEITRRETKKFADVMKNINGASLNELRSAAKQLQSEINKLTPGTQDFITKSKQLQEVNTRIRQLTTSFKGLTEEEKRSTLTMKGLADSFNKYFGIVTTGIAAVTGLSMAFRKSAQDAAALDDTYSDVMKTTGLLHDEVAELDQELMKIDTRTSREQLLLLARDAGKLGIQGKEDVLGFVRAADQIQVALGEDLGEGAIRNLGKIADVLGLTQSMGIEKSLLSIASAVNAVGQASTASEGYLVEFTQRLAGVAAQTGISASNIIGFASGLDQSAMKVEMASTAFQKFLMKLYEDPAKFAAYANLEVGKFTEQLQNDANQAVITILKALKDQDGFASLVPIFKDMGLDGARAVSVLAAMATNIQAVTDAQALANVEFEKATSVTEEYNTKNNNMQAQLEKARKEFQNASIALGQSLNPIMLKSTKATTYLIKALAQYGKEIKTVIIVIAALTVALKARNAAVAIGNAAMKVANALQATGKVITLALSVAYNTLANNTTRAAAAQKLLNSAMNASVIGVILTAVTGLTIGIMALTKRIREARKEREWLNELEKNASVEYAKQASEVMSLSKIVHNNNISLEERKRALEELKKIVPGYHADLTEEGRLIRDNTAALDDYLDNLKKTVRTEIFKESYRELQQQMIEQEKLLEDAKQRQAEALKNAGGNTQTDYYVTEYGELGGGRTTKHKTQYGEATDMVEKAESGLKKLQSKEKEIEQQIGIVSGMTLNAIDEDIAAVNEKYKELFNEIKEQYRDNPAAGEEARQDLEKQKRDEIAAIRQKYAEKRTVETEETATTNAILTQAQFDFLEERQEKLTKKEKEMVAKGYAALSDEDSKALKARYDKLMKADANAHKKVYDEKIKQIEENQRREENALKQSLRNNEITQAEYNARMNLLVIKGLHQRIELAKKYGQDETKYFSQLLDEEIKLVGDSSEELKDKTSSVKMPESEAQKNNKKFWEEIYKKRDEIVEGLQNNSLKNEYENELQWIEKLHDKKLLLEEDYQQALLQTKLKYAQAAAEKVNQYAEMASNFVTALKEAETAKLEAEYQAQLTAAGDNADQREQVEAEYEQKKLDMQKKYADADMAINIAKTVANGAAAAVRAFADSGWVAGSIIAAMIAASTAAEVATIVAQRNAIKNTSLNNSGSSNSSGQRVIAGYAGGGYTEDHTTFTTVGEEGTEWIAPHWMVSQNPVTFRNLEQYRRAGSHGRSGSVSRGFAEGGFTDDEILAGKMSGFLTKQEIEAAVETAIVRAMANRAIRAYLVRKDLTELDNQDARLKAITSLG